MATPSLRDRVGSQPISEADAEGWLPSICFTTGPPGRVGIELELLPRDAGDPRRHLSPEVRGALWRELHRTGIDAWLTEEPGGQVELSARPADCLGEALSCTARDLATARRVAARHGVRLEGLGIDPVRRPRRVVGGPRYEAMARYFARWGQAGATMMCSSAAVQVNVEAAGHPASPEEDLRRWGVLHAVGPALVAAFASSPARLGRPTGWRSSRMAAWLALDPARTAAPACAEAALEASQSGRAIEEWTRYVLDAPVMSIRRDGADWRAPAGLTFRRWLREPGRAVPGRPPPTRDDLTHHLSTMFPPVRPRGYLEVRYIDAQPGPWWPVPVAVVSALVDDPDGADQALAACEPVRGRWVCAARDGVRDPAFKAAALGVLDAAARALRRRDRPGGAATDGVGAGRRLGRDGWAATLVEQYAETWTMRGRSPADDVTVCHDHPEEKP